MLLVLVLSVSASFAADSNQTDLQASDDTDTVVSISETDTVSSDVNTTIINVDSDSSEKLTATGDRDELQTLIDDNYGKEISLDKDYLFTSGTNHAGITISNAITIDGKGHIIDAAQCGRIFLITGENVVLKNISFYNGKISGNGAIINWDAKYGTVDHCNFYNGWMTAKNNHGGAILFNKGYANVSYCIFQNNMGTGGSNPRGGAIYNDYGHMIIDHTIFNENTVLASDGDGGAIWLKGGYSNITYCEFESNTCADASFDIHIPGGTQYYLYGNTFKNGYGRGSGDGDGSSVGIISVSESVFDHNSWIGGHAYSGVSGAFYVRGSCSNIHITNNEFINNTARNYGGAISVFGSDNVVNIVIKNNTFINNTASYGGAIALPTATSSMTIEDCTFINNTATEQSGYTSPLTGSGGAIYVNCFTNILNCEFMGNNATSGSGGAIYTTDTCSIKNTNFTSNVAAVNGGAIYDGNTKAASTFSISNVTFVNNQATENAGALYLPDGATVTLDNYYCSGNTAAVNPDIKTDNITILVLSMFVKDGENGDGLSSNTPTNWTYAISNVANEGTIYFIGGTEYALTGLTISGKSITIEGFDSNVVFNANNAGPIFTVSVPSVTIRNIHFKNAYRAGNGAAITWSGYFGLLQNCIFENCESYATSYNGAVYWSGSDGIIDNCTFLNNKATGTGSPDSGAISWAGQRGTIKNSYFKGNTGFNDGAAVSISGNLITDMEIYNCNFVENTAIGSSGRGGAISVWTGTGVRIHDCNFTKNTAPDGLGGAIYWNTAGGSVSNCIFNENNATNGGAVYWNGATGSLSSSNFTSNVATEKGGAVYWNTNDGSITSSNFNSNRAVNGSAIYLSPSVTEFELKYDKFTSNVASGHGTVAAEQLTDLSLGGNTFTSNTVSSGANDYYFYEHTPENITSALVYVSPSGSASSLGMTSDSPTTFDHALEIIEEGGKIVLLNGEYSDIVEKTISQSIAIVGSGNTVLLGGNKKFFTITANGVKIQDITFKNGKVTGNGGAITWDGANGQIIGSTFTNNVATGNGGVLYWTGTGGKIDSTTFESNTAANGNNIYSTNTVTVTNSVLKDHFTLTKTGNINYGTDEVIEGTFASNAPSSITLYLGTTSYGSISVGSTTFSKTLSLIPVGTYAISFKDANSNTYTFTDNSFTVNRLSTVYISPSGTGSGNSASSPTTWDKVANIITSTGTVVFANGDYSNFYGKTINQGWTLQAASGATPVLDANNKGRIFTVSANNVKIDGLTFKNGKATDSYGSAIHWTGTGGTLTNSVLTQNTGRPVTATTTLTMTNNQLKDQITLTKSNINWAGTETITGTFAHNAPSKVTILFNGASQGTYNVASNKITASYAFNDPSARAVGSYVVTDLKNNHKEVL